MASGMWQRLAMSRPLIGVIDRTGITRYWGILLSEGLLEYSDFVFERAMMEAELGGK